MKTEGVDIFDEKHIMLTIRNSTFDDKLRCYLLYEGIFSKGSGIRP